MEQTSLTDFDAITLKLASPEEIWHGLMERLLNRRPLTIVPENRKETVFLMKRYSVRLRIGSVIAGSTGASAIKALFAINAE
jgi:hypothetical protein